MLVSSRFRALTFRFDVAAPSVEPIACCERLFANLAVASRAPIHHYRIDDADTGYELRLDGHLIGQAAELSRLVGDLAADANRHAVSSSATLTLHAGGVERDGVGFVFPGASQAGKSTLVAGLTRGAFRYVSDEAVALDWRTLAIRPYPKPLGLDRGSWELFPELERRACAGGADEWLVPVDADAVASPCRVAVVAFPRYEKAARTSLEPLRRAEALIELTKNTFRFDALGRRALRVLGALVREVDCYHFVIGDVDDACTLVEELARSPRRSDAAST